MLDKLPNLLLVICLVIMTGYNLYLTKSIDSALNEKVVVISDKIDSLAINTDGQMQDLKKKYSTLANSKSTTIVQKEIVYAAKTEKDDADIELKTEKPVIKVKINDGPVYNFDLLENETSKFQDGKLVITNASTSSLAITTQEYARSKWNLTTAMNADKKVLGGISYSIGHDVAANVFVGQGIKPYYGITWQIGGYKKN